VFSANTIESADGISPELPDSPKSHAAMINRQVSPDRLVESPKTLIIFSHDRWILWNSAS